MNKKKFAALALGLAAGLAAAQTVQPRVVDVRPEPGSQVDRQSVMAVQLARPLAGKPQALCDIWGLRSSVAVQMLEGAKRTEALKALGVPAADADPAAPKPWIALRCQSALPDGATVTLRWLRPERSDEPPLPGTFPTWDGLRIDYRAKSAWPLAITCTRTNASSGCSPLDKVQMQFSESASAADLVRVRLRSSAGKLVAPEPLSSDEGEKPQWADRLLFGKLHAGERYTVVWPAMVAKPDGKDLLANARKAEPLAVRMGGWPPLVKFGANFGLAEKAEGGVVPVTVRAVEGVQAPPKLRSLRVTDEASVIEAYQQLMRIVQADDSRAHGGGDMDEGDTSVPVTEGGKGRSRFAFAFPKPELNADTRAIPWLKPMKDVRTQTLPRKLDGKAFEVIGVPLREPGFHLLEVESPALGAQLVEGRRTMFVRSGALVTDMAVHLHLSHRTAAVWVTRLATGKPVEGAHVGLFDCKGKVLASATSGKDGWTTMEQGVQRHLLWNCPVYAFAKQGGDMGFVQSGWQRGIETWRFQALSELWSQPTNRVVHAVIARNLLKPGETLHARLYWRQIGRQGALEAPAAANLPKAIDVVHMGSGERRSVPVTWDARGNADLVMPVPAGAKRGAYLVNFGGSDGRGVEFRVEDFRLPVLKAEVVTPQRAQVLPAIAQDKPARVESQLRLAYLSGGAAGGERVQVYQRLAPLVPRFDAYPAFWFGQDDRYRGEEPEDERTLGVELDSAPVGEDRAVVLDANGTGRVSARFDKPIASPRVLVTEMEYRDPNGETYRAQGRTPVWPSSVVLGVDADPWSSDAERKAEFVALDPDGKPAPGIVLAVEGGFAGYVSHRRRAVGGYYGYSYEQREFKPASLCTGRTDANGRFTCRFKPEFGEVDSGEYRVQALGRDAQGRAVRVATQLWVYGGGEIWFGQSDHDRIDVLADKPRYKPGETATLQVRSPFREATAWVNVMRSGTVIDTLVVPVTGREPKIRLPIKSSYAPNAFVNVMVVRGRVAAPAPTALVDLARPAYKLGIAPIEVGSDAQLLKVAVRTDKAQYQSRETAHVAIQVTPQAGPLPKERDAAVFVVDEALLELLPNGTWDLFKAMSAKQGYDFESASAAMQVIGKRHYGRKALPPGGGGGKSAARELFETLLVWRGSVALDDEGRAQVDVPVNDSLTRFRVVVVANAGADRFGTGEASFVATKDLQVLSGLPATAREGESFFAGFTLRNTTAQPMRVSVGASLNDKPLAPQEVSVAAGEAKGIGWPVDVPPGLAEMRWRVDAKASTAEGARSDAVILRQAVQPSLLPVRYTIVSAELGAASPHANAAVQPPAGSVPGRGEVRVSLSPALAADASGVREYMKGYPFFCLEQRTSKAVSLKDRNLFGVITDAIDGYIAPSGLVNYYPGMGEQGYDVLTSFVLSSVHEAGWRLPPDAERRMLDGLEQFVRGRIEIGFHYYRGGAHELTERKLLALEALARYRKIEPALAESLKVDPAKDLPQLSHRAVIEWADVLSRVQWPGRDAKLAAVLKELEGRLADDGKGGLRLKARADEQNWYFMYSEPVSQVRLALLALDVPALEPRAGLLARGATNMQNNGATWWHTQANVWGSLMLDKRAARASGAVSGQTTITFGGRTQVHDWVRAPQGETYVFPTPQRPGPVAVQHKGGGKPFVLAVGSAWSDLKQPHEQGASVSRTVRAVKQAVPGRWSVGDIAEVRVKFATDGRNGWIVVSDPVPTGSTLLGNGLKGLAPVVEQGGRRGWRNADGSWEAWPTYVERTFTHIRAYYEYLWEREATLTYQVRINNAGSFRMPPTQVEAMYDPSVFAYRPNAVVEVK